MSVPLPPQNPDGSYSFIAGMAIDGDGANGQSSAPVYAPKGYTPEPLDYLANAGGPGDWYGIVTHSGAQNGTPVVQEFGDPAPLAYVSATSYKFSGKDRKDPRAYLDSNAVPFIVVPSHWRNEVEGIVLGCRATIHDKHSCKILEAIVGDFGPRNKTGEASIACAKFFGVPSSPKNGGTEEKRFTYVFYPDVAVAGYELIPA